MTTYFSGFETTERESLFDTLSILEPAECPLIRSLPSTSVDRRFVEFPIDRYFQSSDNIRSPSAPHTNTRLEGDDWVEDGTDYPTRLRAIAEINHFSKKMSNSDIIARIAGVNNNFDYRSHQLFVKLMNNIENVLMYGTGSPETSGEDGQSDERRTLGLLFWSAWTGLERMHGAGTLSDITDPYGVQIPSDFWSTFFNANHANLSRSMLFNKILASAKRAGTDINGMVFHVGYKLKNLIADFGITPAGAEINNRNVDASGLMTYDSIDWIRTPIGVVGFRENRYLDIEGSTFTVDNTGPSATYTPGSPSSPGAQSVTFQADQTMIGYMPGYVNIGWYRSPHYQSEPTGGDSRWLAAVAEYMLVVRHPKALCGGGNLLG